MTKHTEEEHNDFVIIVFYVNASMKSDCHLGFAINWETGPVVTMPFR